MAPPTAGGNSPYSEELEHANKLLRGIELAVEEAIDDPGRPITRTEQEKLCYFGIEEFDLPITYSWFLAGANTVVTGNPNDSVPNLTNQPAGQFQDLGEHSEVRKYRDYFASTEFMPGYDLKTIWYTNKFDFLCDFYEDCAPSEYRDLYIASTKLREELESLEDLLEQDSNNMSLSDFGGGSAASILPVEKEEEIRLLVSDLHLELGRIEGLDEIVPAITQGTDVIENVLARLTQIQEATPEQYQVVEEVSDFFFYDVWRYPALYISVKTATGPNTHHLKGNHATEYQEYHEDLAAQTEAMMERCSRVDLLPDLGQHSQTLEAEEMEFLQSMTKTFIDEADER